MITHPTVDFIRKFPPLLDLGSFVFPFRVGVGAFSVFEDVFSGFVKNLKQFLGAFNHQFHRESFGLS